MELIDNITRLLGDDLKATLKPKGRLKIAASCFSMYAFEALKDELEKIDELSFIFTSPTFTASEVTDKIRKERKEFHIPKLDRERSLYGSEFEIQLRNKLTQRAVAKECADWMRRKAQFKSNRTKAPMQPFAVVQAAAYQAGFKTIPEVSRERIRRAGKSVISGACHAGWNKDVGFRVLKIDTSNMADVFYAPDALEKPNLDLFIDNIKPDRTPEDLLFQVMLDWGVDLALPIAKQTIEGKEVFLVDGNSLAACFEGHGGVDEAFVKKLAKVQPLRVVFRDAGFKDSSAKINVEQIFKLLSPATEVKCI